MYASVLTRAILAAAVAAAGCSSSPVDGATRGTNAASTNSAADAPAVSPPGVRQIALNFAESCAVVGDGALACWGRNTSGQLGDGTFTDGARSTPQIVSSLAGALAVSVGTAQSCATLASGDSLCWGDDFYGELGDGARTTASSPQAVAGVHGVTSLVTAEGFTCAVTHGGGVSCWGTDGFGELGDDGAEPLSTTPVPVPGVEGVLAVTAGEDHACALLASGHVTCWGANDSGQLGSATPEGQSAPVEVEGVSYAIAIAAGLAHTCALRIDGAILCWGYDGYGTLGDGGGLSPAAAPRARPLTEPVRVAGISDATQIAAGGYETCALRRSGEISCWGRNDTGQLGDATTTDALVPVTVVGITTASEVAVGDGHACARLTEGTMACWGANAFGQLGDGTTTERHVPTAVVGL